MGGGGLWVIVGGGRGVGLVGGLVLKRVVGVGELEVLGLSAGLRGGWVRICR